MRSLLILFAASLLLYPVALRAQCVQEEWDRGNDMGSPAWDDEGGDGSMQDPEFRGTYRLYNPATVETVRGEVIRTASGTLDGDTMQGIHAVIRTDDGDTLFVLLGPKTYHDDMGFPVGPMDTIEVAGSWVEMDGKSVIIAAEVRKGDSVLILRDENGVPLWSGGSRGRRQLQ